MALRVAIIAAMLILSIGFVNAASIPGGQTECARDNVLIVNTDCFINDERFHESVDIAAGKITVQDGGEAKISQRLKAENESKLEVLEHGTVCVGTDCELKLNEANIVKFAPSFVSPLNGKLYTNKTSFEVFWEAFSSASAFTVEYDSGPGWKPWFSGPATSATFGPASPEQVTDGKQYKFRVRFEKPSGGVSQWSAEKSITADLTGPSCEVLKENAYTGQTANLKFKTADAGSGARTVVIEYFDGSWKSASSICSVTNASSAACQVPDGLTAFAVRCKAIDYGGNEGNFSGNASFAVDRGLPSVNTTGADQNGRVLAKSESAEGIKKLTVNSTASDPVSGIANHSVVVIITDGGKQNRQVFACPTAEPGKVSTCLFSVNIPAGAEAKYRGEAWDGAGNFYATEWYYLYTHGIANFVVNEISMGLGGFFENFVQVRNVGTQTVNVRMELSEYSLARFAPGQDFAEYEGEGKAIVVKDLLPQEERMYPVETLSSEPGGYQLDLHAQAVETGASDSDFALINVDFPASFSALTDGYILILGVFAVLAYYYFGRRKM